MTWTAPIDGYCERVGAAFWAEPANALSNIAFLMAALLAFLLWRRIDRQAPARQRDDVAIFFVILVVVIGVGSFLFHTFANRWSSLADVLPIAIFIAGYLGLALYRFVGLGRLAAAGATLAFLGSSIFAEDLFAPLVGSSASYMPALLALLGIGVWLAGRDGPQSRLVLSAGLVFTVSLSLRMADQAVCDGFPLGTHFLWHGLNAVTLGLLLSAAIRQGPRPDKPGIKA